MKTLESLHVAFDNCHDALTVTDAAAKQSPGCQIAYSKNSAFNRQAGFTRGEIDSQPVLLFLADDMFSTSPSKERLRPGTATFFGTKDPVEGQLGGPRPGDGLPDSRPGPERVPEPL